MEMFLMVLVLSLLGVAVMSRRVCRARRGTPEEPPVRRPPVSLSCSFRRGFFADLGVHGRREPQVPIEALLLQIERHVRLEQAAAEAFLAAPDARVAAHPHRVAARALRHAHDDNHSPGVPGRPRGRRCGRACWRSGRPCRSARRAACCSDLGQPRPTPST